MHWLLKPIYNGGQWIEPTTFFVNVIWWQIETHTPNVIFASREKLHTRNNNNKKKLNIESDVTEERLRVSRAPRTCGNEKRRLIDRYINSKIDINQNFFKIELEAFSLNRSSFPTKWRRHGYVGERIAYKQSFFFLESSSNCFPLLSCFPWFRGRGGRFRKGLFQAKWDLF